jgi:hypothetical protein
MLKSKILWFSAICLVFCASNSDAGVVTQTFNYTDTKSGTGSGTLINSNLNGVTFTVNPFNSALGTLDSFTLAWSISMTGDGVGDAGGGGMSIGYGGSAFVNTTTYNGIGNGAGTSGIGPFSTLSKSDSMTNAYTVANAGVTYDPVILAAITGGSTFSMSYKNGSSNTAYASYTNVVSATSTFTAGLTVTYNYTAAPAAVPEPSVAVVGLALAAATVVVRRRRAAHHAA